MSAFWAEQSFKQICQSLGIPRNHPIEDQIKQFLRYCNHDRLKLVARQLGQERKRTQQSKHNKKSLTDREKALQDPDRIWGMLKSGYNESLREYAFLYLAFNTLEDSLRCAVNSHYTQYFNSADWYKDQSNYPTWITSQSKPERLKKLQNKRNSQYFLTDLSFAETIAFLYDVKAWNDYQAKRIFENKINPENNSEYLLNLSRCDVFQKLTILGWRRNSVYHHNLIRKRYKCPEGEDCTTSITELDDGTYSNTRDRIYEILRYLGLKPKLVMERIIGNAETLPLIIVS